MFTMNQSTCAVFHLIGLYNWFNESCSCSTYRTSCRNLTHMCKYDCRTSLSNIHTSRSFSNACSFRVIYVDKYRFLAISKTVGYMLLTDHFISNRSSKGFLDLILMHRGTQKQTLTCLHFLDK